MTEIAKPNYEILGQQLDDLRAKTISKLMQNIVLYQYRKQSF